MDQSLEYAFEIEDGEAVVLERLSLSLHRIFTEELRLEGAALCFFSDCRGRIASMLDPFLRGIFQTEGRMKPEETGGSALSLAQEDESEPDHLYEAVSRYKDTELPMPAAWDEGSRDGACSELMDIWGLELETLELFCSHGEIGAAAALLETHIQLLLEFEDAREQHTGLPAKKGLKDIIYAYLFDYTEGFIERLYEGRGCDELPIRCLFDREGRLGLDAKISKSCLWDHQNDLSAFWGDRLKARMIDALEHGHGTIAMASAGEQKAPRAYTIRQFHMIDEINEHIRKIGV